MNIHISYINNKDYIHANNNNDNANNNNNNHNNYDNNNNNDNNNILNPLHWFFLICIKTKSCYFRHFFKITPKKKSCKDEKSPQTIV